MIPVQDIRNRLVAVEMVLKIIREANGPYHTISEYELLRDELRIILEIDEDDD